MNILQTTSPQTIHNFNQRERVAVVVLSISDVCLRLLNGLLGGGDGLPEAHTSLKQKNQQNRSYNGPIDEV